MNNIHNLKVGQIVYKWERYTTKYKIEEVEISKIGRVYFYLKGKREDQKYDLKDLSNLYSEQIYLTKEEMLDEREYDKKYSEIRKEFTESSYFCDLTLDQLRRIKKILDEEV